MPGFHFELWCLLHLLGDIMWLYRARQSQGPLRTARMPVDSQETPLPLHRRSCPELSDTRRHSVTSGKPGLWVPVLVAGRLTWSYLGYSMTCP